MNQILIVGGQAIDTLHLEGRTFEGMGGAGMYVAMAARRCGARVTLLAVRPDPCPQDLKHAATRLTQWLGPVVSPTQLPRVEISYHQGKLNTLPSTPHADNKLSPAMLPEDLSRYDLAHVTAFSDADEQLSFIQTCRQRGALWLSAGLGLIKVEDHQQTVRAILEQSDIVFINDDQARVLYGSLEAANTKPGKLLFITLGTWELQGVYIIQGDTATLVPVSLASPLDPIGARDTFCGGTVAYLVQKAHPIMAAMQASALSQELNRQAALVALLSDDLPPGVPLDPRVLVNEEQVHRVAKKISTLSEASPYAFVSKELPPVGHPKALDYFFSATLQQFSFWSERNGRYDQPLIARISGVERKGSDYFWETFRRRLEQDTNFCSPERQAQLSRGELLEVFRADSGDDPMPVLEMHLQQARQYGRDMLALGLTPQSVLQNALVTGQPLQTFLVTLDKIGGYKEDPLRKKSLLLAMILNDRPETFLPLRADEKIAPIMDYHFQRACLRIGLIEVLDEALRTKLTNRQIVSAAEEWAVRYPAYIAIEGVVTQSGKRLSAVNSFLFSNMRQRCIEMSEPQCQLCPLDAVCAHHKELFQPVIRTSFY